jgi:nitrate/TMAO reductase-like tetraheme cytochrome c subunit
MKYLLLLTIGIASLMANDMNTKETLFKNECSSCHMAYQAQFLPKRSWIKMMDNLSEHFNTDASLNEEDTQMIKEYLVANSSDSTKKLYGEIAEFAQSIPKSKTFLAITDIPKFKREHREVPKRFITQKEVKSLSNCTACHTDAKKGWYDEDNINIPNYGRWDD